ncbi:hypothetical protein AGLY_012763 [Aphis glycines]|uniref:Large ribosomal subunit protein bL33m n=1 Tax=Aphis glycines TaxID=307491 RepID=A0A6G0T8N3_APHGL|nr:hypothetical protein AGLY_012763 [Aphis glycines]
MFLTNVLLKKVKSKHTMVLMESMVSGHKYNVFRERLADKLELVHFDPWIGQMSVYKERKKIRSANSIQTQLAHPDIQHVVGSSDHQRNIDTNFFLFYMKTTFFLSNSHLKNKEVIRCKILYLNERTFLLKNTTLRLVYEVSLAMVTVISTFGLLTKQHKIKQNKVTNKKNVYHSELR